MPMRCAVGRQLSLRPTNLDCAPSVEGRRPQIWHIAVLALLWLVVVREFQSYVVNPHIGQTVGLSPLVTLISVAVIGLLFGGLAVILAVPFTSAVATLIDVLVLGHEPPAATPSRPLRPRRGDPPPRDAPPPLVDPEA